LKQDKETKEYLDENKAIYQFVQSEGWGFVKGKLIKQIDDLQSIMNLEGAKTPEEMVMDIKVRRIVIEELLRWLGSVEGQAKQFEGNEGSLDERDRPSHIIRS